MKFSLGKDRKGKKKCPDANSTKATGDVAKLLQCTRKKHTH